uniref:Fibronectin type III domain containing 5 n=1 Tax=Anolis carolinensis TaxID=28377 RepID=A0A803SP06_ANOCA
VRLYCNIKQPPIQFSINNHHRDLHHHHHPTAPSLTGALIHAKHPCILHGLPGVGTFDPSPLNHSRSRLTINVSFFFVTGVIALFCRQYDIIKDNEPNNNKEKAKNTSENSTPEHQSGGLLRSKFPKNKP